MDARVIILGAGAAPGVPSLSNGWGACSSKNPKNIRRRTSVCYEISGTRILMDTSPDLRLQLIENQITSLDAVLYTHSHADHLHGIDDLREINRIHRQSLDVFAAKETMDVIRERFPYLLVEAGEAGDCSRQPCLVAKDVYHNTPFHVKNVKITPIKLLGHNAPTTGYVFNDGELVHIADFRQIDESGYRQIKKKPKLLVIPLTTPFSQRFHAGLGEVLSVIERINPEQAVINHMAAECDYDEINALTPEFVIPAYDNMTIELKEEKEY